MNDIMTNAIEATESIASATASIIDAASGTVEKIGYDIAFPHIGIFIKNLRNNISIPLPGGQYFRIAFYGIIIALAMIIAFSLVVKLANKTKQNDEDYLDLFILVVIFGVIGARIYYVIFNFAYYELRPYKILAINEGGLAIFGGIIAAFIVLAVFCFKRRLRFFQVADTAFVGLPLGQAIGRWGNFFNMEAFGNFTDNFLAMRMRYDMVDKDYVDMDMIMNKITEDGIDYVQAHPTFLYESFFNLLLFIILYTIFTKKKKFNGQVLATYLLGYGIIRFFVESLRTDSLMFFNTGIRVSQAVAILCVIIGLLMYIYNLTPIKNNIHEKISNTEIYKDIMRDLEMADKERALKLEIRKKEKERKEAARKAALEALDKENEELMKKNDEEGEEKI